MSSKEGKTEMSFWKVLQVHISFPRVWDPLLHTDEEKEGEPRILKGVKKIAWG